MAKIDPKLLKKVNQSKLILAAKEMKIKNPEKVSKEALIPAFIKAVEAVPEAEQENLDPQVIETYNEIIQTLGLGEPEGGEEGTPTTPVTKEKAIPKEKEKKAPKVKKEAKPKYTRIQSICDAIRKMKKGTAATIGAKGNELYVAKGGMDRVKDSIWYARFFLDGLANMGTITKDGSTFISMEK